MNDDDKIIEILEGFEIEDDKIVQIVDQLKEEQKTKVPDLFPDVEKMIENEEDPLKRAALVAGKISRSFDEESTP